MRYRFNRLLALHIPPVTPVSSPVMAAEPSEAKNTDVEPFSDDSSERSIHSCLT